MELEIKSTGNSKMDFVLKNLCEKNWKAKALMQNVGGDFSKLTNAQKAIFYKTLNQEQGHSIDTSTQDAIDYQRNVMAFGNGNYPLSMSDCYVVGLSGNCGNQCPVLLRGDCKEAGQ